MSNRSVIVVNLLLSGALFAFLMWLIYAFQLDTTHGERLGWLPSFNAACNAISATAVSIGILCIRRARIRAHTIWMILGTAASALFLVGYLVHHSVSGDTRFQGQGVIRPVYFFILITHIVMAAVALPLILNTLSFAALRRWASHRRVARWTYPVWIYVSVTGVLVWVFLRVLYPSA